MTDLMVDIAVDIGGTFTDVVALRGGRHVHIAKVPSTPGNLIMGISQGVQRILQQSELTPDQVTRFVHSSTVATNAILEKKGGRTALLATEGFRDSLEIGRQRRSELYNVNIDVQTPTFLAPRRMRAGIRGRMDAEGNELVPLDEQQVLDAVTRLRERYDIEAVAVCYLHAFINPAHERRTRELIQAHFPDLLVSLSSDVDPVFREYERAVSTAFDAYVRPKVSTYLGELERALKDLGLDAHVQVMQSRGGLTTLASAAERPVTMLLSGPAAGVMGGRFSGELSGDHDVITLDIGGTSCDVALVRRGKPILSRDGRIDRYPLRISMVDVNTIGAGGGSLAWIDRSGGLHVGPESAGSDPGPACYGRGGTQPTVTDASVVLGYLNPGYFAGGTMKLDGELAKEAVGRLAAELGLSAPQLAGGIHRIMNDRMAEEVRLVSVRRGYDPRHFSLVPLGGAGPVHGGRLAPGLSMKRIVVPATPGVLAAFGLLVSPLEHESTRAFGVRARNPRMGEMVGLLAELTANGDAQMARDGVPPERVHTSRFADVRYVGQSYELEVELGQGTAAEMVPAAVGAFHDLHLRIYGHNDPAQEVEFVNLRVVHRSEHVPPQLEVSATQRNLAQALKETRPAWFDDETGYQDTPVYERILLPPEERLTGPVIIEQVDTTTVVYPGQTAWVDAAGNVIITFDGSDAS